MRLELSSDDVDVLRNVLHDFLPQLRMEVARTEDRQFRHEMVRRQEALERLLARLDEPEVRPGDARVESGRRDELR